VQLQANNPPMNILLVVPWDDERGGVVSVAENLTRRLQARGHNVLFLHPGPSVLLKHKTTKLGFPGVELRLCFPFARPRRLISGIAFPFLFPLILFQLLWLLKSRRIQIVNLHYPLNNFFYFAICKRLLGTRLATSVHGRDAFYREKPLAHYSRAFRFVIDSSDLIILPSDAYRRKFLQAFPHVEDKTIFIHNCVNPAQFQPSPNGRPANGAGRYLLCVAGHEEYKGIDVLLQAVKPLLDADPTLNLKLAGDGIMRGELERLAVSLGIQKQTQFLGQQGASNVAQLLQGCEVFVLPSREEPFGIVLIEAMACKKPIVATRVGGIPEIVEHGKNGILVEPDNPSALTAGIRTVLANPELQQRFAEHGHAIVSERFYPGRNGAAYEQAFASLVQEPNCRGGLRPPEFRCSKG